VASKEGRCSTEVSVHARVLGTEGAIELGISFFRHVTSCTIAYRYHYELKLFASIFRVFIKSVEFFCI